MKILYDNEALNATITGSYSTGGNTALIEPVLSSAAFFTTLTGQYILFDHSGLDAVVEYACLYGSNLTDNATVYLQGNPTNVWTSPAFSMTLSASNEFTNYTTDDGDYFLVDENGDYIVDENNDFVYGEFKNEYAYWRLYFSDALNPDAVLIIPWFFYGTKLDMPGWNPGATITRKSNAITQKSSTGQLYGSKRIKPKSAKFSFAQIEQTDKELIDEMFDYCDITTPFIILIWENDLDVEAPLFASLVELPEWNKTTDYGLLWSTEMNIEECF